MQTTEPQTTASILRHELTSQNELNLSYMPFILNGGIFIQTDQKYKLGDKISLTLILPTLEELTVTATKVIWITPHNSSHQAVPGVGVQFIGIEATVINERVKAQLDTTTEIGGYVYGALG